MSYVSKGKKNAFWLHNTLSLVQISYFKNTIKYNTIHANGKKKKVKWKAKRRNGQMEKPKTNS